MVAQEFMITQIQNTYFLYSHLQIQYGENTYFNDLWPREMLPLGLSVAYQIFTM